MLKHHPRKSCGSPSSRPKRSAVVSTVTSSRHAHETHRLRHFGSPEFWRAVALARSRRRPKQPIVQCGYGRRGGRDCRTVRSVDATAAACLARGTSHRTSCEPQSRSADPRSCQSAAGAHPWRPSRALRRRLHTMPGALEKGGLSADPGAVLRPVRHWCASGVDTPTPSSYATPGRRPAARKPITLR